MRQHEIADLAIERVVAAEQAVVAARAAR